ncbi:MAG TPA: endonuclease/exonuclease/phosphatase family protein [Acidimicrobiia bacterium]|nr:endonuclease/exonuclease/phosphatase family protein [Acidimicrobiia bacterium]
MRTTRLGILFTALVFVLGIEMARFHFGSLGWYQRDTVGIGALDLIPIAAAPFLAGLLLPALSRWLSLRYSLLLGVVVLAVARVANQVLEDPALDHWTSGVAVAALVGLLPLLLSLGREVLVGGVLVGITLDSAIKGLGSTLDLAYRPGVAAFAATVALAIAAVYLTVTIATPTRSGPRWGPAFALLGFGPYLFVQYQVLQSPGWISEMTNLPTGIVAVGITALNVVGLWAAQRFGGSRPVVALAVIIVATTVVFADGPEVLFSALVLLAIPAAGVVWAGMVPDTPGTGVTPATVAFTGGSLLFLMVGFAYYLPLDLDLGFSQLQARVGGAVLLVVFVLAAVLARRPILGGTVPDGIPILVSLAIVLPLVGLLGARSLPDASDTGPVRYMAYNLHQAFDTGGEMDVGAIAAVIEDSGAAVVGLQEVARAGLLNANTDLVYLLGERLGWEHVVFMGTTDPVWGNAILSRYPLGDVERHLLPRVGTPYQRGYLAAPVATPEGEVLFISTHLQHINDSDTHDQDPEADLYPVHHEQLAVVIEKWAGREPAVLVGDLNARPGWRQVEELLDAGWIDSWAMAGSGDGYTANAADPRYRIDYVFHTPDLTTVDVEVIESQASDHFAVLADLTRE